MGERILQMMPLLPAALFALVLHEYAHGLAADRLGDPTPRLAGRLTLNPLSHLDVLGTLMLLVAHVGWARPVPIDPRNFDHPRVGMVWVSLAGPLANMAGALGFGLFLRIVPMGPPAISPALWSFWLSFLFWGMVINLVLAAFNLLPLPPLDGSRVLQGLLPVRAASAYGWLGRLGPLPLLVVVVVGRSLLWKMIAPFVRYFGGLFAGEKIVQLLSLS
jgi:Zn-dependent protease